CEDFKVDGTAKTVELVIQNGMGQDLSSFTVTIAGTCVSVPTAGVNGDTLSDGEKDRFVISCTNPEDLGSRFKEDIVIGYTAKSGIAHNVTGSLTSQVE
ncbi:hypothetical protein COS79_03355, partial [Candidatus Woesearchaeota archaeon CG06_land_8_20_14_3_00_33_13]